MHQTTPLNMHQVIHYTGSKHCSSRRYIVDELIKSYSSQACI
jgi:hypothetical protein